MKEKLPILVVAYNRPTMVEKVMHVIQVYRPNRIYIACDGPRFEKEGDRERVIQTRETLMSAINWECETHTLFRERNVGCAHGVSDAITWFFTNEEYGVIIEDDVIVSQDFFLLCEDLLPRYKEDMQVLQISSRNTSSRTDISNTYVYTQVHHCWGWATWRRAWHEMETYVRSINKLTIPYLVKRLGIFRGCMTYRSFRKYVASEVEQYNDWDTCWYLSILVRDGLVICPGVNLGKNIGLTDGEHYSANDENRPDALVEIGDFIWPIEYNDFMRVDKKQKKYDSKFFLKDKLYGLIHKFI